MSNPSPADNVPPLDTAAEPGDFVWLPGNSVGLVLGRRHFGDSDAALPGGMELRLLTNHEACKLAVTPGGIVVPSATIDRFVGIYMGIVLYKMHAELGSNADFCESVVNILHGSGRRLYARGYFESHGDAIKRRMVELFTELAQKYFIGVMAHAQLVVAYTAIFAERYKG